MKLLSTFFSSKMVVALLAIASVAFVSSCKDDDDDDNGSASASVGDAEYITENSADVSFQLNANLVKIDGEYDAELFVELYYIEKSKLEEYEIKSLKELIEHDEDYFEEQDKDYPKNYKNARSYVRTLYKNKEDEGVVEKIKFSLTGLKSFTEYVYVFEYDASDYNRLSEKDLEKMDELEEQLDVIRSNHGYIDWDEFDRIEREIGKIEDKAIIGLGVTSDKSFKTKSNN